MPQSNINKGYRREKLVLKKYGVTPVPFSGSVWQAGKEDGADEDMLVQVKSTSGKSITVEYEMLAALLRNKSAIQTPILLLDFVHPSIGPRFFPETQWAAVPADLLFALLDLIRGSHE